MRNEKWKISREDICVTYHAEIPIIENRSTELREVDETYGALIEV